MADGFSMLEDEVRQLALAGASADQWFVSFDPRVTSYWEDSELDGRNDSYELLVDCSVDVGVETHKSKVGE